MAEIKSKKTINSGLLMMLIVILVAFFITYLVSAFFMLEKNRNDYGIRESETIINGVAGNVSSSIGTYKNLSRLVMVNQEAVVFLKADEANPSNVNDARYGVMDVMNATSSLDSIFIFRNDGNYMKTGKGLYDIDTELLNTDEWRNRILDKRGGAIIMINAGDVVKKQNGEPTVTVARAIYDINSQKLIGMLLMNFSTLMLDEAINSQDDQYICIVSTEGKYLSGDEEMAKYFSKEFVSDSVVHLPMAIDGKRGMVSGYRIPDTPLVVVCYTNSKVSVFTNATIYALLSIMLVFIIGTLYAAKYITKNITTPITELTSAIERTKKSDYLEKLDVEVPENEIGTLSESYNGMVDHVNQLFNELIEKEKSVQRAEMRVLHEQIKPHFLYNTLGTIGYMALCDGAEDVHEALETLGSFYRNFLSKGDRDIPLSREISIIKDYLAIQKLRYGEIIEDEYDIAENVKEWLIPKLILQPVVENSIYHGIRLKGETGLIKVTAYSDDDGLHLIVYDSGLGMEQDVIDKMLDSKKPAEAQEEDAASQMLSGFGLRGTIERVRYYCGRDDVVKIRSEVGEYTEIEFIIPVKEE